jgi:hypothetical protein
MDRDQTPLLARLQRQRIIMANQMSGEPGVGTNQMIAAQQPYMHTPASGVMGQQMMTHWNPYLQDRMSAAPGMPMPMEMMMRQQMMMGQQMMGQQMMMGPAFGMPSMGAPLGAPMAPQITTQQIMMGAPLGAPTGMMMAQPMTGAPYGAPTGMLMAQPNPFTMQTMGTPGDQAEPCATTGAQFTKLLSGDGPSDQVAAALSIKDRLVAAAREPQERQRQVHNKLFCGFSNPAVVEVLVLGWKGWQTLATWLRNDDNDHTQPLKRQRTAVSGAQHAALQLSADSAAQSSAAAHAAGQILANNLTATQKQLAASQAQVQVLSQLVPAPLNTLAAPAEAFTLRAAQTRSQSVAAPQRRLVTADDDADGRAQASGRPAVYLSFLDNGLVEQCWEMPFTDLTDRVKATVAGVEGGKLADATRLLACVKVGKAEVTGSGDIEHVRTNVATVVQCIFSLFLAASRPSTADNPLAEWSPRVNKT